MVSMNGFVIYGIEEKYMSHVLVVLGLVIVFGALGYYFIGRKKAYNNATPVVSANTPAPRGKLGE